MRILALLLYLIFTTQKASALVWQFSLGYGFGLGEATSKNAGRALRSSSVSFPVLLNPSAEVGSENLRFFVDVAISYSPALGGVDLLVSTVGSRYFLFRPVDGLPGERIVAIGSRAWFLPYISASAGASQYSSLIRDRDGLTQKVTATALGGAMGLGLDFPLNSLLSGKTLYENEQGFIAFLEGRFMTFLLGTTQPTLETNLLNIFCGARWRF